MATTIKLKNSVTTTSVPSSLVQGEVAINITDKKVWVGNAATTPIQLLGGGADGNFTNISVSSVATFGAGTVSAPSITFTGDTNTGIYSPAADTIAFTEGGVEAMRITSAGNLLVGTTTTPNQQAVIYRTSATTSNGALLLDGNGNYAGLQFAASGTLQGSISSDLAALYITHEDAITFNTGGSGNVGGSERMRIDSSGNVGIGTSSPAFKTEIVGGADTVETTLFQIRSNFGGINTGTTIALANSTNATAGSGRVELAGLRDTSSGSSFVVRTADSSGTVTERMRIDSFGRVYLNAYSNNLYGNNAQQLAINTGTTGLSIQTTDSRSTGFWTNSGSAGTSNAATYLQFFNNSAQTNVGSVTSTGTNCLYNNLSDYRLKEDISPIINGLALVSALKPINFKWSSNKTEDFGFIAHEFQEVIPNFVTGNKDAVDEKGKPIYQAMDSSGAIPLLVAAIQEQQQIINDLKARIETLESK